MHIFTDHQALIFSISQNNPNTKMKGWRAFVEAFSPTFHYNPGMANVLSRQFINNFSELSVTVYKEQSLSYVIKTIKSVVNHFRIQLMLSKGTTVNKRTKILF